MTVSVFFQEAAVVYLNQALFGQAASNAVFTSHVRAAIAYNEQLYAKAMGDQYAGTSDAAMATKVLTNMGITATTVAPASYTALEAAVTQAFAANPTDRGIVTLNLAKIISNKEGDATWGAVATAFNDAAANNLSYSNSTASTQPLANSITAKGVYLTTGFDSVSGSAANDNFVATIYNNANSLNSGDRLVGGAGTDRLDADIGSSQSFAITALTSGIETIAIRAEADPSDSGENNLVSNRVQIDAQRMKDVLQWENSNSRADLIIEDVRINDSQITKDITIAMVETDPGNVDFGLYFDPYSLRSSSNTTNTLTLELLDTRSQAAGTGPLKDNPYDSFGFLLNGNAIVVKSAAIDSALTYADLRLAIENQINVLKATTPALANFTVTLGSNFNRFDTVSGSSVTGTSIILTDTGSTSALSLHPTIGWATPTGTVPPSSGLHTNISTAGVTTTSLVTSKVILDDVGRGSTGGDLVIGSLSVGDTSSSKGVERFEIEVRDNSKLQTINSTNNTLKEVTITSGTTTSHVVTPAHSGVATTQNKGNLTVNGKVTATNDGTELPGAVAQHNGYGFSDVRLIDASTTMNGKLAFTAEITESAIAKYINLVDPNPAAPSADNIAVTYTGGTNDDTMSIDIDGATVASRSKIISGREDFTFTFNGGTGNDTITVKVDGDADAGSFQNWANNQDLNNNITINGGDGNDTIWTPGAGDTTIDGGAGKDVIYTDNTGSFTNASSTGTGAVTAVTKAAWVFNTVDQTNVSTANAGAMAGRNLNDLRSDTNESYNLYNAKLVVTFKGLPTAAVTIAGAGYKTTDLEINQAIKAAINGDATLKNLLVAKDGPANSLIIESKIDGVMSTGDLTVSLTAPAASTLTSAEIAGAGAVYGIASPTDTNVLAAMATALTTYNTNLDYQTQLATDGTKDIIGAASTTTSDNFVTPGADNDVIVLGTTVGIDVGRSSNEVVTYAAGFGDDVIVNFAATGNGVDHLNLGAFLSAAPALGAVSNAGGTVTVAAEVTATNGTTALIKAMYDAAATPAAATKMVYIAYDAHQVGKVYSVTRGTTAGDATVTLQGSIDLASTLWTDLTTASFTVPTVLAEGSSSIVPLYLTATGPNQTLTGSTSADFLNDGGFANVTMTGGAGPDTFTGTGGGAIITDLATGDIVTGAGTITANNVSAFVATAATTASALTINSLAAGSTVNMALATSAVILMGGVGVDNLTGTAGNDTITTAGGSDAVVGGAGNDTINVTVGGTVAVTGGTGTDTIAVSAVAGLIVNVSDLAGSDVITVGAAATLNATGITSWTATGGSSNAGTVTLTSAAAGSIVSTASMAGANGATFTGGAGIDTLTGNGNADTFTGGAGVDTIAVGAAGTIDTVIITAVTTAADRDVITGFTTTVDKLTIGLANTTAATVAGAAVVTNDTTGAGVGGAAYALTGATTAVTDVILLQSGAALTAAGVNSGDLSLATATDGTELLKALTTAAAADTYTGITAAAAGNKAYLVAVQAGNTYVYLASDANSDALITASEIVLVGTFTGAVVTGADYTLA